jgi:hypothetical protein
MRLHAEIWMNSGCLPRPQPQAQPECLLADFRDHRLRFRFLAEVRQQQEQAGQPLLARIEQLIDQVCFDADALAHKVRNELFRECRFLLVTCIIADFSN